MRQIEHIDLSPMLEQQFDINSTEDQSDMV